MNRVLPARRKKRLGSPDDPAARGAARLMIIHTFIGIIIIIIALYLVQYVTNNLIGAGGLTPPNPVDWLTGCGIAVGCL